MQRSRSPFAAHQRKKSPRGYSPRKSPFARGSSPKKGRKSPFACGSSPKRMSPASRSSFAYGSSPKNMSPARRSPFACGSSPKGSHWEVTKSPYKSLFSREPSPRKSPFAVKGMKYHLPACYQGFSGANGNVCRQKKTKYYNKDCYGPKTKAGRPDHCDPGYETQLEKPCFWGWRNTIWGNTCQKEKFPVKDNNDPNIRCMGGGPTCLVKPKYKTFSPDSVKKSAECYSGFMHRKGFKDPICRRLAKATKYSDTQCFGPKGKDGKRPESCEKTTTTNKTNSAECYSGFMHGKRGKICRRLAKATKYSNTPCFGPKSKKDGTRPTSCDITSQNYNDQEITDLEKIICKQYHENKDKYDGYDEKKIVEKLLEFIPTLKLTVKDKIKLYKKLSNTCFSTDLTKYQERVESLEGDKEALKNVIKNDPNLEKKIVETNALTQNVIVQLGPNNLAMQKELKKKIQTLKNEISIDDKNGKDVAEKQTYLDMLKNKLKEHKTKAIVLGVLGLGLTADYMFNGGAATSAATDAVTALIKDGVALGASTVKQLYDGATLTNAQASLNSAYSAVGSGFNSVYTYFTNLFTAQPELLQGIAGATTEQVATSLATAAAGTVAAAAETAAETALGVAAAAGVTPVDFISTVANAAAGNGTVPIVQYYNALSNVMAT